MLGPNFVTLPVTLSVNFPSIHHVITGTKFAFGSVCSTAFVKRRITSSALAEKDTAIFLSLRIKEPLIREWQSIAGDDKRIVQKIECQPIGGLKFFRQSNCDLKPAHLDDEFISQFFRFNRAKTNAWPKGPYLARYFVREFP
jgi:hypothetical protein